MGCALVRLRQRALTWVFRRVDGALVRLWCPLNGRGDWLPDWVHEVHFVPIKAVLGFYNWARPWFDEEDRQWLEA